MGVAAENRNERRILAAGRAKDRAAIEREITQNTAQGEYDHIKAEAEFHQDLRNALVKWNAARPQEHDYATKAEALEAARAVGGKAFPLKCFTAFESFWTVALFTASGWRAGAPLSVEGRVFAYWPATPEEVAGMAFRKPPVKPVYIATQRALEAL